MICVEQVILFQVERDSFELGKIKRFGGPANKEVIHGRIFNNARGEEVCIAMTREVQIAIGLPFEVFEDQGKKITNLSAEVGHKNALLVLSGLKLSMYEGATFFERLKYLFPGSK